MTHSQKNGFPAINGSHWTEEFLIQVFLYICIQFQHTFRQGSYIDISVI